MDKLTIIGFVLIIAACSPQPEEINFGEDQCAYCKMTIADNRFGSELVTDKGKVYKFDALECQINFIDENDRKYAYTMAVAYDDPGKLYPVDELTHIIDPEIKSPMGAYLSSWRDAGKHEGSDRDEVHMLDWSELLKFKK